MNPGFGPLKGNHQLDGFFSGSDSFSPSLPISSASFFPLRFFARSIFRFSKEPSESWPPRQVQLQLARPGLPALEMQAGEFEEQGQGGLYVGLGNTCFASVLFWGEGVELCVGFVGFRLSMFCLGILFSL